MSQVDLFLAQSGEVARLSQHLRDRLQQSGWYDEISALAARELSMCEEPNFETATAIVQTKAMELVPQDIKDEMLQLIRSLVDQVVEKA